MTLRKSETKTDVSTGFANMEVRRKRARDWWKNGMVTKQTQNKLMIFKMFSMKKREDVTSVG